MSGVLTLRLRLLSYFLHRYFVIITPVSCQRTYDFRKMKIVYSVMKAECDSESDNGLSF